MKAYRLAIIFTFLAALSGAELFAAVVKHYDPNLNREDLFLVGFGEISLHALNVHGNKSAFETENPWLNEDFTANYRTSLLANGHLTPKLFVNGAVVVDSRIDDEYRTTDPSIFSLKMSLKTTEPIWDGWRFTGEGLYDPQRRWDYQNLDIRLLTQPQEPSTLELLARLESDKYGFVEGGSLRSSFKNSQFTLNKRSLFGVYADLHSGPVGLEAVGGKMEGKAFREGTVVGIRANGTSGPYDLTHAPVTRNSETVKIETRDRFNETTVLETRTLIREIDYTVDYDRGRIILNLPVASETIESNPNYVVITYDYQRNDDDELAGSRVHLMPVDGVKISGSYLHRFEDIRAVGAGEDEPENLVAADASFAVKNLGTAYLELAGSEDLNSDQNNTAFRGGFDIKPTEKLSLAGDFQEIDDQFKSFTNSDLNAVKNQRRWGVKGGYDLTEKQKVTAAFQNIRGLEPNGEFNNYPGERDEKIYTAGYRNNFRRALGFGIALERRDVEDLATPSTEKTQQQRAAFDIGGEAERMGLLGLFGYGLHYEYIDFENKRVVDNDRLTHQAALTMSSTPSEGNKITLTQKTRLRKDTYLDLYEEREDGSFLDIRMQPHRNLSSLTTAEYKRFTVPGNNIDLWQDDPFRIDRAGTFALEYIPMDMIKATGKIGRYEIERAYADSTTKNTDDFLMGQVNWFPKHHLSFGLESEFRYVRHSASVISRDKLWDLGVKLNWNRDRFHELTIGMIRRWQLQDHPPSDDITAVSYILLTSGSMSLGKGFFARGAVKAILLRESLDDEKTFTEVELGYEHRKGFRVSAGYERIESDNDQYSDRDYRGHGIFVRLVGKI